MVEWAIICVVVRSCCGSDRTLSPETLDYKGDAVYSVGMNANAVQNLGVGWDTAEPPIRPYEELMAKINSGEDQESRTHHLSRQDRDAIIRKWHETGQFVSPYAKGVYSYTLDALYRLGPNKAHQLPRILAMMKSLMSVSDWERFAAVSSAPSAQKPMGKLWVNLRQFSRWGGSNPYGWKLKQIGCVVDRFVDDQNNRYARLNTYAFRGWDSKDEAVTIPYKYLQDVVTREVPARNRPGRMKCIPVIEVIEERPEWTLGPAC